MRTPGRPRLLILSASTGNGHISAALALEKEAIRRGLEAKAVDTLMITGKAFRTWYGGGYEAVVRSRPELWGHLYKISDKPRTAFHFQSVMDTVFVSRARTLIQNYKPDIVVCTHSLPQPQLARQRENFGFKVAVVVTDMYPHLMWLRGDPDHYFVPSEWSKEILIERTDTPANQITVSGIPIDPAFAAPLVPILTDPPTILLTVGGIGAGPLWLAAKALAHIGPNCRIVVVCGRNESARQRMMDSVKQLPEELRSRIELRGHVARPDMVMLMHQSALIVGKPGGLTTSEALAAGVPFVVFNPLIIPGQEEGNAEFLAEHNAGVVVESTEELAQVAEALLKDPVRLASMRASALSLGLPQAADTIVTKLIELSQTPSLQHARRR